MDGQIERGTTELDEGGSRPDAIIEFGDELFVVLESKAVANLDGAQLARHAFRWELENARVGPRGLIPPPSWSLKRWQHVSAWARTAAKAETEVAAFLLRQLAEYLELAGVTDARIETSPAPGPGPLAPAWLDDLAAAADLERVALACQELYGDEDSPWFVSGDGVDSRIDTRADSRRVAEAFRAAGQPAPPSILKRGGDVITPRRALSILYGPDRYERSVAEPDVKNRAAKLKGAGADRAVLLGILAWAWPQSGALVAHNARRIVAHAWRDLPSSTPAASELHERLDERARVALQFSPLDS